MLSLKWTFVGAVLIFEVGSAICGASPNSVALIVGRAIAGIGGAGIFSGALIIIAKSVPLAKRPAFTGIIGAVWGIASVVGPLLGGVFTSQFSLPVIYTSCLKLALTSQNEIRPCILALVLLQYEKTSIEILTVWLELTLF